MNKTIFKESLPAIFIIILTVLLLDPFMYWMPNPVVLAVILASIISFAFFATYIWKEKAQDEREELHRILSARISLLVGVGILLIAIIYESIVVHNVNPWLIITLVLIVSTKIVSAAYYAHKN